MRLVVDRLRRLYLHDSDLLNGSLKCTDRNEARILGRIRFSAHRNDGPVVSDKLPMPFLEEVIPPIFAPQVLQLPKAPRTTSRPFTTPGATTRSYLIRNSIGTRRACRYSPRQNEIFFNLIGFPARTVLSFSINYGEHHHISSRAP